MALVIVMDSYGSVQELSTDSPQSPFVGNYFRISLGIYGKCIKFAKLGDRDCCALSFRVLCGAGRRADTDIMKLL